MGDFHALLVEGIPAIGKSTLIDGLTRRDVDSSDARRIRSFLHLSQSHTYGPLAPAEDYNTLTIEANLQLLDRITQTLDSRHLTHCLRPEVIRWDDVVPIDRRLAAIGCKLLLLTGKDETIRTRTIRGRAQSQFLTQYAIKFGQTREMIHAHFVREQAEFVRMFRQSALEKRMFENDGSLDTIVKEAFAFWIRAEPRGTGFLTTNA